MERQANRIGNGRAVLALLAAALAALSAVGVGCRGEEPDKTAIRDIGSDTMLELARSWAEAYGHLAPGVSVEVAGGGSGVGVNNLIQGSTDIANCSRDMHPDEMAKVKANSGKDAVELVVGYDGIGVYVHKDNPVGSLTMEQLARIFCKEEDVAKVYPGAEPATRWSQVGVTVPGDDRIVLVGRQNSSGTYAFFREHVLKKRDYRPGIRQMSGSKEVVELVGATPGAIGYSGMGYKTDAVKFVHVAMKDGEPAYEPNMGNVVSKKYPLARSLLMYALGRPAAGDEENPDVTVRNARQLKRLADGDLKTYFEWILSPAGQKIVQQTGYIPLTAGGGN